MSNQIANPGKMGDYISRSDAKAVIQRALHDGTGYGEALNTVLPVDVRPVVRGHWVWNPNGMDWGLGAWCCDQCRIKAETWWANDRKNNPLRCSGGHFCGNCGAKMEARA